MKLTSTGSFLCYGCMGWGGSDKAGFFLWQSHYGPTGHHGVVGGTDQAGRRRELEDSRRVTVGERPASGAQTCFPGSPHIHSSGRPAARNGSGRNRSGCPWRGKGGFGTVSGRKRKALALLRSLGRAGFLFCHGSWDSCPTRGPGQLHGCPINSSEARWTLEEGLDLPLSRANRFMESAWMTSFPLGGAGVRGGREGVPLVVQWLRF